MKSQISQFGFLWEVTAQIKNRSAFDTVPPSRSTAHHYFDLWDRDETLARHNNEAPARRLSSETTWRGQCQGNEVSSAWLITSNAADALAARFMLPTPTAPSNIFPIGICR